MGEGEGPGLSRIPSSICLHVPWARPTLPGRCRCQVSCLSRGAQCQCWGAGSAGHAAEGAGLCPSTGPSCLGAPVPTKSLLQGTGCQQGQPWTLRLRYGPLTPAGSLALLINSRCLKFQQPTLLPSQGRICSAQPWSWVSEPGFAPSPGPWQENSSPPPNTHPYPSDPQTLS